jgi:predicted Zn-dependent protease
MRNLYTPLDTAQLLSREECEAIAKRTLAFATADETRVTIQNTVRVNTRFATNQVTTSGYDINTTVTVLSAFGNRSASLTTNKLDDESLATTVRNAEAIAKLTAENPERMPELGPQQYRSKTFQSIVVPNASDRATAIQLITDRALKNKCEASGYLESQANAIAIATSRGLFAYDQFGGSSMTTTVRTEDGTGSGWAGANALTWGEIDPEALSATAVQKAIQSRNPVPTEPGHYTVILEPTAVGNLVQFLLYAASARAADEGRSFFARQGGGNKIGLKVVDERVTIYSDPRDSGDRLFDSEGLPTQKITWIEKGVVKNLRYDRYWAQKQNKAPTPVGGFSLRMDGGSMSIPEMVANTKRGILVTRFWYIRSVDPRTILYTGLTRDGTFLIENGKVTHAVKNFRYNDSPIFMLNNIEALGQPVRVNAAEDGSPNGAIIVPAIKAQDFNFTSLSDAV